MMSLPRRNLVAVPGSRAAHISLEPYVISGRLQLGDLPAPLWREHKKGAHMRRQISHTHTSVQNLAHAIENFRPQSGIFLFNTALSSRVQVSWFHVVCSARLRSDVEALQQVKGSQPGHEQESANEMYIMKSSPGARPLRQKVQVSW